MSKAENVWQKAFMTMKDNKDSGKFDQVPTQDVRGNPNYILQSDEFQALMSDCKEISQELKRVVDEQISSLGTSEWAFWTGGGGAQAAAQSANMVCLESTAFGQLFDGLSIQGFPYDMELWGALSLAYTEKAASEAEHFDFHAFIAEDASATGVFTNIEMLTFEALTEAKAIEPDIHFHAVAVKGHEKDEWSQIEPSVNHGGYPGTYDVQIGKADEAPEKMQEMSAIARDGNRARHITPHWEAPWSPTST